MSLKFGLNLAKKSSAPRRKTVLDDEDDDDVVDFPPQEDDHGFNTPRKGAAFRPPPGLSGKPRPLQKLPRDDGRSGQDLSSVQASKSMVDAAQDLDPSIFDYDSFHDAKASVTEAKKAAARQDAIERKPKYINNLLDAAARRKQDQQIAKEKLLQREREAEGDEFADKEKFVTGAYKLQQEENRRLEEEEKKKAEIEEQRKRKLGGGMQQLYRNMMAQSEREHQETLEATARLEQEGGVKVQSETKQSDAELAAELKAKGVNVHLNEEGEVTDKRQLLSAGLNVAPVSQSSGAQGADHLKTANRTAPSAFAGRNAASQQAQRERQSRMLEEQLAVSAKRAREEEEEERVRAERAAKSTKTEKDVSDAKARYLARKAAKERGEG